MSRPRPRKPMWSICEWVAFGLRCQALRGRLDTLIQTFPICRGLKPRHINLLIRIHDDVVRAMLGVEHTFANQHPEENNRAIRTIHGDGHTTWAPTQGRAPRSAPDLSRERWVELGHEVKAIRAEAFALSRAFDGTRCTKSHARRFSAVIRSIGRARIELTAVVECHHPGWVGLADVFYGPNDPELESLSPKSTPTKRARIVTPRPASLAQCRWSAYNVARMLNATGERPPRVREMRRILGALGLGNSSAWISTSGVFDHGQLFARDGLPAVIIGCPYHIEPEQHHLLAELKRFLGLRVEVDATPSPYRRRTHHVRIEVIDPRRRFKPGKPTHKTRAVRRTFRAALRAEGLPVGEPDDWIMVLDPTPETTP